MSLFFFSLHNYHGHSHFCLPNDQLKRHPNFFFAVEDVSLFQYPRMNMSNFMIPRNYTIGIYVYHALISYLQEIIPSLVS
jgi:hypothetical protein